MFVVKEGVGICFAEAVYINSEFTHGSWGTDHPFYIPPMRICHGHKCGMHNVLNAEKETSNQSLSCTQPFPAATQD